MKKHTGKRILPISSRQRTKLLSKIKTVSDLLARDDVNDMIRDLDDVKPNISDLIFIYIDKQDNYIYYDITPSTLESMATWMLESTKLALLNSNDD